MTSPDIRSADRHSIRDVMARLTPYLAAGSWLPTSHPYANGRLSSTAVDHQALAEYIAVSAVQHAFDGWAYWGRAVAAEIIGDSNVASHLGYYAELRAAKAILASEGIGLFSSRVAVVDSAGQCVVGRGQGRSSHQVLWNTLNEWSIHNARTIVFDLLKPFGHPIADWLGHFPGSSSPIAEDWLRTWGLDLKQMARDGTSRNVASYNPSGCPPTLREKSEKILDNVTRLWRSCEPTGTGASIALDRLVLRATLETVFRNSDPSERLARQAPKEYCAKVRRVVESLPLGRPSRQAILRFLDPQTIPEGMDIFEIARRTSQARAKTHVNEVLSRAMLLLRLATACAHDGSSPFLVGSRSWA